MNRRHVVTAVAAALVAHVAQAQVTVEDAWVRGTVQGQKATGAYMRLKSTDGSILVGAESLVAGVVEIHVMRMEGNVMRMRSVPRLELPPGQTVELNAGGYHMMLLDLKRPLQVGDIVPIKLKLEGKDRKTQEIEVRAKVRDLAASSGHAHH